MSRASMFGMQSETHPGGSTMFESDRRVESASDASVEGLGVLALRRVSRSYTLVQQW